jgi:branched-chain amino acid aminotransferase
MIIWLDGELLPLETARVSPLDRGLTVGDGVFETLRVYSGVPFAWTRHLARLRVSADGLGLSVIDATTLRQGVDAVLAANTLSNARVRITITGGEGPPGSSRAGAVPRAIVVATPFVALAPTTDVVVAPWTRNERSATAGLKTLSYAANVRALAYAEAHGATEALFANTSGNLCEATGSNVFAVLDNTLVTPPPSAGCLLGVTRGLVLELAEQLDLAHAERDIAMVELPRASELFLSSTTREVQQIAHIDGVPTSSSTEFGARLAAAYVELVARTLDP